MIGAILVIGGVIYYVVCIARVLKEKERLNGADGAEG